MYQTQDIGYLKLTSNLVIKWVSNHSAVNKAIRTRLDMIYGGNGPRNAPNAHANLLEAKKSFGKLKKRSLGSCLVFSRTRALERFAISHFARENPRITPTTKERSNHYTSSTQNALRT